MLIINNVKLPLDYDFSDLTYAAAKALKTDRKNIKSASLFRKSVDARHKNDVHFCCSLLVSTENDKRFEKNGALLYSDTEYIWQKAGKLSARPVVAGFGPAGMFAALALARAGMRPLVLERGQDVDTRIRDVENFFAGGALNTESNVQFGEGGAGTFSDGKLNTGTKDRRMGWMLREFAAHGAPESVIYDAKPHIGTDILIDVVQNIRREVIALGGEVRFGHRLEQLNFACGRLTGAVVHCAENEYTLPCERLILAIGHSARDTFENLNAQGVPMQPKPFSMGVRIEHLQKNIDLAQYGRERGDLPAADYSLNVRLPDGTSAYTFCMCPGGEVFAAASETGGVVTNGMSYSRRDGENANSALLVTLHTEDFPDKSTLGGMYWQREIERAAYAVSGSYCAPAQLAGDFLAHRASTGAGEVKPSYRPGVAWCELHDVLPERITSVLEKAIPELGKKLHGFDAPDAVLTAPETRSSSPVRILRGETLSSAIEGLYPCGEGAGYAGGISSAAVDGMRCAEAVLKTLI